MKKFKKPKLGDMVRIEYRDHGSKMHQEYLDAFNHPPILMSRGRFIGTKDGYWFVESDNWVGAGESTVHLSVIVASCITEVKIFGFDDSPLPEDIEDLLKK